MDWKAQNDKASTEANGFQDSGATYIIKPLHALSLWLEANCRKLSGEHIADING